MTKKTKKTKKTKTLSKLDKDLWEVFARYIKLRDAKGNDSMGLYGYCCTCNKKLYIELEGKKNIGAQAGHYIPRGIKNIKFDERNVHLQCGLSCNKFGGGKPFDYELFIIEKYGQEEVDRLKKAFIDYKSFNYQKLDRTFYEDNILKYKEKVKELEETL